MSAKPVIVFVPGAWHGPSAFGAVMKQLEAAGYETEGVTLASVGAAKPLDDFGPDVKAIQSTVQLYEREVSHTCTSVVPLCCPRGHHSWMDYKGNHWNGSTLRRTRRQ